MLKFRQGVVIAVLAAMVSAGHAAPGIAWRNSFASALKEARRTHKPIMIDFYTVWCSPCKQMDKVAFVAPPVVAESRRWITVKVNGEKDTATAKKYDRDDHYPTVAFVKPNGTLVKRLDGYQDANGVLTAMKATYARARG